MTFAPAADSSPGVPSGWVSGPLKQFTPLQRGFDLPSGSVRTGTYPVLYSNGLLRTHAQFMVKGPGVVTGRSGTIGQVHFVEGDFWPHNTTLWVTSFRAIVPKFAYYLLQYVRLSRFSSGSGVPTLNRNDAHAFRVTIPGSKAEQAAIAACLSDVDQLIATLEQLIAKKAAIAQGLMQQLLTASTRLPGFASPWKTVNLGEIAHIKTGSRNTQDKKVTGRYPFYVRSATVERIDSYSHDCEAILVPGEGGIGSIFHYVDGRFSVHQRVYVVSRFRAPAMGKFIFYYMRQFFGRHAMENSVKATVDSLRRPTFANFTLQMPDDSAEQRAIVSILDDADAELELLRARLAKVKEMRGGMVQELLSGHTRLPSQRAALAAA